MGRIGFADDIEINVRVTDLSEKTVTLIYEIKKVSDRSLMVEGREKRICLDVSDPARFKAMPIPENIYACLEKSKNRT